MAKEAVLPSQPANDEVELADSYKMSLNQTIALLAICLTHMGDAVEIYLPAILTQDISCDLGLDDTKQGILSVVFYSFYAVGSFASGWFANHIGRRRTILISYCLSFLVSTLAAISHNFYTLALSRAATGILVGSNYGITNIYWTEIIAPNRRMKNLGLLVASLSFSTGAGYTSLLAYFTLQHVGWRIFFVLCSLPLFMPPLVAFCFLPETGPVVDPLKTPLIATKYQEFKQEISESDQKRQNSNRVLILHLSLTYLVNIAQGWGLILFVPQIYSRHNEEVNSNFNNCHAIFGDQYLKMTLISGLGPLTAKLAAYFVQMRVSLPASMLGASLVSTFSFILIASTNNEIQKMDFIMGVIKAAFAYLNLSLWLHMMAEFTGPLKAIATTIVDGSSKFGALLGSAAVAFLPVGVVEIMMSVLGVSQTIVLSWLCYKTKISS